MYLSPYKDKTPVLYEVAKGGHTKLEVSKGIIGEVRKKLKSFDPEKGMEGYVAIKKKTKNLDKDTLSNTLKYYSERKRKKILGLPIGKKQLIRPYKDKVEGKSKEELLAMLNKKADFEKNSFNFGATRNLLRELNKKKVTLKR